jgi:hypothetical protein
MAEQSGDLMHAAAELEGALTEYPDDYALTLRLAWIFFLQAHYLDAERAYRAAIQISKGAPLAQLGLSWSLVRQRRCDEAREELHAVETRDDTAPLLASIDECDQLKRVHGAFWTALGGALYSDHPWKDRSADVTVGAALSLPGQWSVGATYRGLRLWASDDRVANIDQHEGYLQAGYAGPRLGLALHGAVLFAGYSTLGRSEHVAVAGRWTQVGDALLELTASIYPDLLVTRVAPAWSLGRGPWRLVPGLSVEHFAGQTLVSGSLLALLELGRVSLSAGGKYGPEYRAAYLSRSAVFNSEDRSEWAAWLGVRTRVSAHFELFVTTMVIQLRSPDEIVSRVQLLGLGASCHF